MVLLHRPWNFAGYTILGRYSGFGNKDADAVKSVDEHLKNGKFAVVLENKGKFTEGKHFILLLGYNENGKVIVWDSNYYNYWDRDGNENGLNNYREGYDLYKDILATASTCIVIDDEFKQNLLTNANSEYIKTDEGNLLLIDYTQEPIIDDESFAKLSRNVLIPGSGLYTSDSSSGYFYWETEPYKDSGGTTQQGKINVRQTDTCPIQFPTREISVEEAIENGIITEEEAKAQGLLT